MAITATFAKLNDTQFAETVRSSVQEILETTQVKLDQAKEEGRTRLSKGVQVSSDYAGQVSQFLADLAIKIAPPAPVKRRVAAKKVVAKRVVKAAARKPKAA